MLDRRDVLEMAGAGLAGAALPPLPARPARPPGFVVVFADDLGWGDLGCYGCKDIETPNLDRLAREGTRFTGFYAAQAVCSASRTGLLTGCYPNRLGIRGALGPGARHGIGAGEATLAELLKGRGYATGIFGKWHLGHLPPFLPLRHGFDDYLGLPYSNDMWPVGYDGRPAAPGSRKSEYPPLPLVDGQDTIGYILTQEDQDGLTARYTERAVRFLERHRHEPFLLYLPHSMPHVPLGASARFRGRSPRGLFGDVIMEIDWSVGRILETLERLGRTEDTLVLFASDNGPWLNFGDHAGSAGPFREGKGTSFEGGVRVPCIVRWPGRVPAGAVCRGLASTLDILPTFAGLAGAPLPAHRIDGVDLAALLGDPAGPSPRDRFFYYYPQGGTYDQLQAVRLGRWKLHFPHKYRSYEGQEPGRGGLPGPTAIREIGLSLHDLAADPGESRNVAAAHPDVVAALQELGEKAREDLGDQERRGRGLRPPGRLV